MNIKLHEISIREITTGYSNDEEEGVVGYGGKLNIRPKYQREFVYKDAQQKAVIETVQKDFPLNVMYWVKNPDDTYSVVDLPPENKLTKITNELGTYEVLDGQQRTISICEYVAGSFSYNGMYFHSLTDVEQNQILDYKLMVYFCEGNDKEKLDWFRTINIAGEKLTDQELRNAIYTGTWLTDAKRYFSKTGCGAYGLGSNYLNGSPIRQDYLETAIRWISKDDIEEYMSRHQHDENATELWGYYKAVIDWIQSVFPTYRKEMKGLDWGYIYNEFKDQKFDTSKLEMQVAELMKDEDVSKKSGIYEYLLSGKEKYLNIRAFSDKEKRESFERQNGICIVCQKIFEIGEMEADHITPWHEGGKTNSENCQMLCKEDNRRKSGR
jgi:REP element-mobilizing transposase RayT